MLRRFKSQEQRRACGGSCFIEIQHSQKPINTAKLHSVLPWALSSLYIHDEDTEAFYREYGELFGDALHANGQKGGLDLNGINYFDPAETARIIARLRDRQPTDSELLLDWLTDGAMQNGFFVLGI